MNIGAIFVGIGMVFMVTGLYMSWDLKTPRKGFVAFENAQIITRTPGVRFQEGPMVIRNIRMEDGTYITENWKPVIGKDGQPDLQLVWQSRSPPSE